MKMKDSPGWTGHGDVAKWGPALGAVAGLLGIAVAAAVAVCALPWQQPAQHVEARVVKTPAAQVEAPAKAVRETDAVLQQKRPKQVDLPADAEVSPPELAEFVPPETPAKVEKPLAAELEIPARLQPLDTPALLLNLERFSVADLDHVWAENYPDALLAATQSHDPLPVLELYRRHTAALGMPRLEGESCVIEPEPARVKSQFAFQLRRYLAAQLFANRSPASRRRTSPRDTRVGGLIRYVREWNGRSPLSGVAEAVSIIEQILQPEGTHLRFLLVDLLAEIDSDAADRALVRRAVYDLNREIRRSAREKLAQRWLDNPVWEAAIRSQLLEALRYPWPPISEHAAETLVAVEDADAIPALVDLLDDPDPAAPLRDEQGRWVKRQLVRVNHLRNCFLCHPPANVPEEQLPGDIARVLETHDPAGFSGAPPFLRGEILGAVPVPGTPLPPPRQYYSQSTLDGMVVRADVVYIRQDFSLSHAVEDDGKWPEYQRFDYFVCLRQLTAAETSALEQKQNPSPTQLASYPQRNAVLFALRNLTGQNPGDSTEAWRQWLQDRR